MEIYGVLGHELSLLGEPLKTGGVKQPMPGNPNRTLADN
jgi:hypothetical protein